MTRRFHEQVPGVVLGSGFEVTHKFTCTVVERQGPARVDPPWARRRRAPGRVPRAMLVAAWFYEAGLLPGCRSMLAAGPQKPLDTAALAMSLPECHLSSARHDAVARMHEAARRLRFQKSCFSSIRVLPKPEANAVSLRL